MGQAASRRADRFTPGRGRGYARLRAVGHTDLWICNAFGGSVSEMRTAMLHRRGMHGRRLATVMVNKDLDN